MYCGEDQPAEGEPPDENQYERVYVGRGDYLVDGADLCLEGSDKKHRLPDGKIGSLPFPGLCQGGGRGGAIQGKEGIKF